MRASTSRISWTRAEGSSPITVTDSNPTTTSTGFAMTATLCFRLGSLGGVTGVALFTYDAIAAEMFTHRDGGRRTALDRGETQIETRQESRSITTAVRHDR